LRCIPKYRDAKPAEGTIVNKRPAKPIAMPTASRRGSRSTWKWVAGAIVAAVVVWQVLQGVFVKSIKVPAGEISFFPPKPQDNTNTINQPGYNNRARIRGSYNKVYQGGHDNKATIGGLNDEPTP
jgi:hypothetical protein